MKTSEALNGLDIVKSLLKKTLHSDIPQVQKPLNYVLQAPGKMIRPSLVLISASLFASADEPFVFCETDKPVKAAAAVELIHTASLIHDDIIDNAAIRRGMPALHVILGEKQAVKIGNYLLSKAFLLLQSDDNNGVMQLMNKTVSLMCEGEAEQLEKSFDLNLTEKEYYRFNYKKTAKFLAACCEAGARSMGITDTYYLRSLKEYGLNLGYAFQIADDILDFTARARDLDKPVGNDFKQGTVTLPLIYTLQKHPLRRLITFMKKSETSSSLFNVVKKIAVKSGAVRDSLDRAYKAGDNAYNALNNLPPSVYRDQLRQFLDMLLENADSLLSGDNRGDSPDFN